jgi:hypothetical protein
VGGNSVKQIRQAEGKYGNLLTQLQETGEAAFKFERLFDASPPNVKLQKDIYNSLSSALVGTIEDSLPNGAQLAVNLKKNNKVLSEFFSSKTPVTRIAGKNIAPESVFKSLVENGNSQTIISLRNTLSGEEFNLLKGAFVDNIINTQGGVKFNKIHNTFLRKRSVVENMFTPSELQDIQEIIALGQRADMKVLSSSGTGASESFSNIVSAVRSGFSNEAVVEALKRKARNIPEKTIDVSKKSASRRGDLEKLSKIGQPLSIQETQQEAEDFQKRPLSGQAQFLREQLGQ